MSGDRNPAVTKRHRARSRAKQDAYRRLAQLHPNEMQALLHAELLAAGVFLPKDDVRRSPMMG